MALLDLQAMEPVELSQRGGASVASLLLCFSHASVTVCL